MRFFLTLLLLTIPFNKLKIFLLNLFGHCVSYKAKIGFSVILVDKIIIEEGVKIGHFNFIKIRAINLKKGSFIGNFNILKGPFTLNLDRYSGISKSNKIRRAYEPVTYGYSKLALGENSFIVSNHFIDLTKCITVGKNSIIAGINSQLWTHGYYHANQGSERIRIDGEIHIGDNVYVGSGCIFNPGVKVGNAIHIGAGSVISKDLNKSGMYVGQALRFIDNNLDTIKSKLSKVEEDGLIETVYKKINGNS